MKILLLHNKYLHYGGEDSVFEAEKNLLMAKGHQVESLIFQNKALHSLTDKLRAGLYSIYNPTARKLLKEKIAAFEPQIIHVHNFWKEASPAVFYEAAAQQIPIVFTLHNFRLLCANALLLRQGKICELCTQSVLPLSAIRYACYDNRLLSAQITMLSTFHKIAGTWKNKVDAYICFSNFAKKKFLHSALKLPEERLFVKPNFVEDKGEGEAKERKAFFLYVGRLSEQKGIATLLEASQQAKCQLEIIGGGDLEPLVRSYADQNPNIIYHGFRDKKFVLDKMKQAKALMFPSVSYEGMPLVILEAFSTGLPVLISDIDNLNEIVQDSYNGWLFEPQNSQDLAEKIKMIQNLENYAEFCKNARHTYQSLYTPEASYQKLIAIYEQSIAAKKI
ncbi:MAG: glycosyltransferase family 4 protein [Raineya sp.]